MSKLGPKCQYFVDTIIFQHCLNPSCILIKMMCGSVVRALRLQRKRLWVRFPGNTYKKKNVITWMQWIKASAKCINVNVHTYRLIQMTMCKIHIHILSTHSVLLYIFTVINTHYTPCVHILHYAHIYTHSNMRRCNRLYISHAMSWMCIRTTRFFVQLCSVCVYSSWTV